MEERRLEIKVGALLLSAVAGVLGLLWLMGELSLGSKSALSVEFGHSGNVVKGAPVKLGGVGVGRIDRILLVPDHRDSAGAPLPVRMELSVDSAALAALREDASVTVATQGPLGEPYLELNPGSARSAALGPGKVLRGVDAPRLDLVATRLSNFLESMSKIVEDDPRALSTLFGRVTHLSQSVDQLLADNRVPLGSIAVDLASTVKDLRAVSARARAEFEPGGKGSRLLDDTAESAHLLRRDLPQMSKNAGETLQGLAALSSSFTPEDGKRLRVALQHYAEAGAKLDEMAARGDRILAGLEAGEGTAGAVLKDPQVYQDLKDLLRDLRKHPWKVFWKD